MLICCVFTCNVWLLWVVLMSVYFVLLSPNLCPWKVVVYLIFFLWIHLGLVLMSMLMFKLCLPWKLILCALQLSDWMRPWVITSEIRMVILYLAIAELQIFPSTKKLVEKRDHVKEWRDLTCSDGRQSPPKPRDDRGQPTIWVTHPFSGLNTTATKSFECKSCSELYFKENICDGNF